MTETDEKTELVKLVREIRSGQRMAGVRGWIQVGLQAIGLVLAFFGTVLTLGSLLIWLFLGIFLILLISLAYQLKQESTIRPSSKEREELLRILAVEKTIIENMNLGEASFLIDLYYEILRFVCTTLHPDGSSKFDESLWNQWQIKAFPKNTQQVSETK